MKNLRKVFKICLMMTLFLSAIACKKGQVTTNNPNYVVPFDQPKFQKIEKFISISWATPIDKVAYDEKKQEFTFGPKGEIVMSREKVESIYNSSNVYKAKYEKE